MRSPVDWSLSNPGLHNPAQLSYLETPLAKAALGALRLEIRLPAIHRTLQTPAMDEVQVGDLGARGGTSPSG